MPIYGAAFLHNKHIYLNVNILYTINYVKQGKIRNMGVDMILITIMQSSVLLKIEYCLQYPTPDIS
jgi:hypothetical protein